MGACRGERKLCSLEFAEAEGQRTKSSIEIVQVTSTTFEGERQLGRKNFTNVAELSAGRLGMKVWDRVH